MAPDELSALADLFRLLGEPNRLGMVAACLDAPQGVGELTERSGLSQSLVSHHLRLLRAARLLRAERRGRQVFYAIADGHVRTMLHNMIEHMTEPHPADGNEESDHEHQH
ncbi:MAG: helix-turn-helix transcriptional regulator [Gluconacetobacter diazotrophicus]|nr:helix-turn-helix transcriptional regulator [Gluconacetobacter diazotrophicus]